VTFVALKRNIPKLPKQAVVSLKTQEIDYSAIELETVLKSEKNIH